MSIPIPDGPAPSADGSGGGGREQVASFARGLQVIRAFGHDQPAMTLAEVARRAGLTRAAARRFLLTLEALGYVRSDGRLFALTPRVLEIGYAYLASLRLPELAAPFMEEVVRRVQESCSICVLDGDEVVYVARIPTSRIMSIGLAVGARLPAVCTSTGRVLLAALPEAERNALIDRIDLPAHTDRTVTDRAHLKALLATVREDGHALLDQELETGLRAIAVPLANRRGETVAAINVGVHATRATPEQMRATILPVLLQAAAEIRRILP